MARKLSRRSPRHRFALSAEAEALIRDGTGRWEHVQLSDGDAAQGMVPGVKAKPPLFAAPDPEPEELADPNQLQFPGLE